MLVAQVYIHEAATPCSWNYRLWQIFFVLSQKIIIHPHCISDWNRFCRSEMAFAIKTDCAIFFCS